MSEKTDIYIEIMNLERAIGVTPHGSRHVGGWTEKSDWDYFCDGDAIKVKWLQDQGYIKQFATGYWAGLEEEPVPDIPGDGCPLIAFRHPKLPIQVLALSHDYYRVYFAANELVKSMQGAAILETREGRVTTYKHFIAQVRKESEKAVAEIVT